MKRVVKKPDARRAEIIEAARRLFLAQEYDQTTMQDIMRALGIAKGTIYHYFDSKEKLLEAVVADMVDSRIAQIEAQLARTAGNALEKIKRLVELGQMAQEHPQLLEHLHRSTNAAMHIRILAETILKLAPIYEKLIRQGCGEGLFKTEHPRECAEFVLSAIQFLMDTGIYPWTKEDLHRRAKAFPRLIEQQLQARPGSFSFMEGVKR